jgi:YbbR domain-containing protein
MLRRLFGHFGLKVLSAALALSLWFMVAGQKQAERALRVPLEFANIPEALELMGEPPSFADVRVRGASGTLGQLRGGDLVVILDLSTARAGRRLFQLTADRVTAPTGVRVLHVIPATVALTFEASISKKVPVVPVIEGLPAAGFVRGRTRVVPQFVDVIGPESIVKQLAQATTEPVNLTNAAARVRDTVNIGLQDPTVRLRVPQSALVMIEILPAPIDRVVSGVPVSGRNLRRGLRAQLTPHTATVTVRGAGNVVRQLTGQRVPAFADLSGLQPGQYNLPVRVDLAADYSVVAVTPATVRVRIN